MRNRYLDIETGTFLTEDTYRGSLTNLKSHNRYSYAENNPVNKIDPSGHKAKSISAKKARSLVKAASNAAKRFAGVSTSNRAGNHKASRAKSSHSTHKAKTASSKHSGHRAKKSSGGGLVNSFLGFCSKRLNQAKKAIKKAYKKVCTTANRAKKFVANTAKNVTKKAVSVVKSAGKAFVKFKQKHPIITGLAVIGVAGVLTIATGGLTTGVLATAISGACTGAFAGSVIGAAGGATFEFIATLHETGDLKKALNSAAQGFGTGAISGAVSGGIAGGLGAGAGLEWGIRTFGDTAGDLIGRAVDGKKITAGDVVLCLGINAAFNAAGPKVLDKVKNSKAGQWVEKNISKGVNAVKGKVGSAFSTVKEKVSGKLAGTGAEAVNVNSAASGVERKTDFYAGSKGIATSLEEYDQFAAGKGQIANGKSGNGVKPEQLHHFATNKNKIYTPQFEKIVNKYGLDLDDVWNKEYMPHQGRHPNEYHEYVLDNMVEFDKIAQGDKIIFLKLYEKMKKYITDNPDMLYKDYWRNGEH